MKRKTTTTRIFLKTLLVTLTLSALLALPVAAATPAASQKAMDDAARIFETHAAVPLEGAELSREEMTTTEGAWIAPMLASFNNAAFIIRDNIRLKNIIRTIMPVRPPNGLQVRDGDLIYNKPRFKTVHNRL